MSSNISLDGVLMVSEVRSLCIHDVDEEKGLQSFLVHRHVNHRELVCVGLQKACTCDGFQEIE